jgi:DNA repair exonuclease SbcCD ATPase subunit
MGLVSSRRSDEMSRRVSNLTRDRGDWKKRATKAARRERTLEHRVRVLEKQLRKELRRQNRPVADTRIASDDQTGALAAMQERVADADTIDARLAETERALSIAREHLNAIEVKLEILEGAANVLDARTRAAITHHPDETGAAVR